LLYYKVEPFIKTGQICGDTSTGLSEMCPTIRYCSSWIWSSF